MKFSHKGSLFTITEVWFRGFEPETVYFQEKTTHKTYKKSALEISEKLKSGELKYEGI